jgi:DNA polymerase elongation subunit (family B)
MYENQQYEKVWRVGYDYFCRTRDLTTKQVRIEKIYPEIEYFESNPNGDYSFILDPSMKLTKKVFTNSKEAKDYKNMMGAIGKEVFGGRKQEYKYIRDHFFDNGKNADIRIWHFDIEVAGSCRYHGKHIINVEVDGKMQLMKLQDARELGNPPVLDEESSLVIALDQSCYKITKEFPDAQTAEFPVTQIQIYDSYSDKIIILSLDGMKDESKFKKYKNLIFKEFDDEVELFKSFLKLLDGLKPTVISAWNADYFDFPYITNRAMALHGVNYRKLSPIQKVSEIKTMDGLNYSWEGIFLIDLMKAYKKFIFTPQASYSLENIAKAELGMGEGKVDYGEHGDIITFYHNDIDKFIEYSIQDVIILKKLEDKLKLIELMKILSTMMGINMDDTFGTVKPWGQYLTNLAMKENLVMPLDRRSKLDKTIVGGYVRHPVKGKNEWLVSIDVNSMYPLLGMRAFNMSPETYINEYELPADLKAIREKYHTHEDEEAYLSEENLAEIRETTHKYDVAFGMNAFFRRDHEGIIPRTVDDIYTTRKEAKRKMLMYNALKAKILSQEG